MNRPSMTAENETPSAYYFKAFPIIGGRSTRSLISLFSFGQSVTAPQILIDLTVGSHFISALQISFVNSKCNLTGKLIICTLVSRLISN